MRKVIYSALISALLASSVSGGNTNDWKKRTVYQLLTDRFSRTSGNIQGCGNLGYYCGGTFQGIINHLDYIQNMGFDAIWISPVVDNIDGGYHGYWAANWEKINSNFGSADDLKNLVKECHNRGIWVMVDVVANHAGPVGMDFSRIYPLNQAEHYHSRCQINNWGDQHEVEYCRLADLPDLNQDSNQYVRTYLKDWIRNLVQTYGFDGIRIDTIPEVPKDFWREYGESAGVFQMGEVFNGDSGYVGDYQNYVTGLFNYPMYFTIKDIWGSGQSMYKIRDRYNEEKSKFKDLDALGVFVDNHDNARFLNSNGNQKRFKNALAFSIFAKGIPFVYYGSEQGYAGGNDPNNRETLWTNLNQNSDLYKFVQALVKTRRSHQAWNQDHIERYVTDTFYAFSRGDVLIATTNTDNTQNIFIAGTPFSNSQVVCNIFYPTSDCVTINNGLQVTLVGGETKVYVPKGTASLEEMEKIFSNETASDETIFLS